MVTGVALGMMVRIIITHGHMAIAFGVRMSVSWGIVRFESGGHL
jgi:hypothetical protein